VLGNEFTPIIKDYKRVVDRLARFAIARGLENYTFLTSGASVLRTNVYAGPKSPILRGFSNTAN
jgi:hypothetical protein